MDVNSQPRGDEQPVSAQSECVRPGRWLQILPPGKFSRTRVTLPIRLLPQALAGLRILHLSDLHLRRHWFKAYDQLIECIRADPPDLLLFTGDIVEHRRMFRHET